MADIDQLSCEGIVSATRLHFPPEVTEIPQATKEHLRAYAINAQQLGVVAAIAVNSHEEEIKRIAQAAAPGVDLHVLPVPCWGAFVPALNALLEFAQKNAKTHILYQSLEVQCSGPVLHSLLDHFNKNVLVVGPVLDGHTFCAGEQRLNGRTVPWNTLALWSVRKLALTGFLRIADGLPQSTGQDKVILEDSVISKRKDINEYPTLLGSNDWWGRQVSCDDKKDVPAGVEEVTAVALLQHLLGRHRALALLVQLPEYLNSTMSWKTNWGQDERRKQWHEYKMASKVSRPNAQLQELFSIDAGAKEDASLNFGTVMHVGSSIRGDRKLEYTCLAGVGLFYFNSTAVLAPAFKYINSQVDASAMAFISFIIGGVYLLMPMSLQITRKMTQKFGHKSGLLLFSALLLLTHLCVIFAQFVESENIRLAVLLATRIVQGLGSGICFQSRFVLANISTSDQHTKLQARTFIAGDLGLGLGALLPAAISLLSPSQSDLWSSFFQAAIHTIFLVWVLVAFPRHIHFLPNRVRFPSPAKSGEIYRQQKPHDDNVEAKDYRGKLLISGTLRVFVQSAMMPTIALLMQDAHWTGQFRQAIAVGTLYLLQLPFEALASRVCCACPQRSSTNAMGIPRHMQASGLIAIFMIAVCPFVSADPDAQLAKHVLELAALVVMLAVAAPANASRLYQLHDAERTIVRLEWLKAYVGRLLGPIVAVILYTFVGYTSLLTILCSATLVVVVTA